MVTSVLSTYNTGENELATSKNNSASSKDDIKAMPKKMLPNQVPEHMGQQQAVPDAPDFNDPFLDLMY